MRETDKNLQVSKTLDVLTRNSLTRVLVGFANYCRDLCKTATRNSKISDSYMFLKNTQKLYVKNKILKMRVGNSNSSAENGKSVKVNDSLSTDNNILKSDHCLCNFHSGSSEKCPQMAKSLHVNKISADLCKMSSFDLKRKTSETVSFSKYAKSNVRTKEISTKSATEISDTNPKDCDTDKDASLECNPRKITNADIYLDSNSNISSSSLKISGRDSHVRSTEMFSDECLKKFYFIKNDHISCGNFENSKSDKTSNSPDYTQQSTEVFSPFLTTAENRNQLLLTLKPQDSNGALHHGVSDSNSVTPDVLKISRRDSKSLNPEFENSNVGPEIFHNNLKFVDSDKNLKAVKQSDNKIEVAPQNITNAEFPETNQVTVKTFSEFEHDLTSDIETITVSDAETINEVSSNFGNTCDECDHLNNPLSSEDRNTAIQDHISGFSAIPSETKTSSSNNFDNCLSNLKMSDSDTESYHSDLMFSDNDIESNSRKESNEFLYNSKELQNVYNAMEEYQDLDEKGVEVSSNSALTSENDEFNFARAYESLDNEDLKNFINIDNEADRLEAFIYAKDAETASKYISSRNSISPNSLIFNPLSLLIDPPEYCDPYLTLSPIGQDSKSNEQSYDVPKNIQNLVNTSVNSESLLEKIIIAGLSSGADNQTNAIEQNKSEFQKQIENAFNTEELQDITMYIRDQIPNNDRETNMKRKNEIPSPCQQLRFKQSKISNSEEALDNLRNSEIEMENEDVFSPKSPALDNGRKTAECMEKIDNDPDTLDDIFKTVIKVHPIKKSEIPAGETAYYEGSSEKLENIFPKYASTVLQLYGIKEHRDTRCFHKTDSSSVMTFDVTDCFNQNSSLICDGLVREYLDISAKVNLLVIKQIRNISNNGYESRILSLRSLEDELGYISAKFITTINDWVKQLDEIGQNVTQSKIGSRGLYHMGILKICVLLVSILLNFTLEKQLELENYEKFLTFHKKVCN